MFEIGNNYYGPTGSHQAVVPGMGHGGRIKQFIGIGSYKPEMREFPDEVFPDVKQVLCGYRDTLLSAAGAFAEPLQGGSGSGGSRSCQSLWDLNLNRESKGGGPGFLNLWAWLHLTFMGQSLFMKVSDTKETICASIQSQRSGILPPAG